jgi:hypothetical protein
MKSEEPMKALGENCFGGWRVLASILLTTLPTIAFSQGRPDIIWAKGGHSYSVNSVTYSPDGQLLVSGSSDRTIKVWRQDGTFIRSLAIPYDFNHQLFDVLSVAIRRFLRWKQRCHQVVECLELDARAGFVRSIPFWAIHGHQLFS